ncbi:hypothetical protein MXD62_01960 [Frankia sp. Mgl5]|uniref:hypothetical protein n=1 Tax=Frankia sp. Mgl5 TaxID=2933793 RepID=UPI00200E0FEF|nr:hypothetical protein [Frankia sp. Mgl5]MCK9925936.1 hypothetical protein [Frankia sp. Mgl5]
MDAIALVLIPAMALLLGMGVYLHQRGRSGPGTPPSPRSWPEARGRVRIVDPNSSSNRGGPPRTAGQTRVQMRRDGTSTEGCQVCGDTIGPGEPYSRCTAGHPHHRDCMVFADNCALPNCSARFA